MCLFDFGMWFARYTLKLQKKKAISVCYFGDGSASEGDFHAALNFASTTESPVLFFVRNNGYIAYKHAYMYIYIELY